MSSALGMSKEKNNLITESDEQDSLDIDIE
jgi:hypothetical protein